MGFLHKLAGMARKKLREDPRLADKVGDAFDKATKHKYAGHTDKAQEFLRRRAEGERGQPPR